MKLIMILTALYSLNAYTIDNPEILKDYSQRFNAYTISPEEEMDEAEKERRNSRKISNSKLEILRKTKMACSEYENRSGWKVKTWEINDFGWISGEGEVEATFSCVLRKPQGSCNDLSCSLGCIYFGGRCCIDKLCTIY